MFDNNKMRQQIQPDNYRYINLFLFILAALSNSIPTQAFSGISPIITELYSITQFQANIPSFVYPVSYIFLLIPANYILDKKGLKIGTAFCEICMIIGLSLRLLINVNYYYFCLGTFVCSLGFCFMISGATKFANIWFGKNQIFFVNSICMFAIFGSDALGTFLSSYNIRQNSSKEDVFTFFLIESSIMILINILMLLFFKNKPKSLQNYASIVQRNAFKKDLYKLVTNKNYRLLFLATAFIFGDLTIIFVFLPWISKCYEYQSVSNGIIIVCANIVGLLSCVIIGLFGKKYTYRFKCIALNIGFSFSLLLLLFSFQMKSQILSYIIGGFAGMCAYPFLTTITDFAVETSFPVGEATSGGILIFGGQFFGVILAVVFSSIFDGSSLELTRLLQYIMIGLSIMGILILYFSKQILKRTEYQSSKEQQKASLISQNDDK